MFVGELNDEEIESEGKLRMVEREIERGLSSERRRGRWSIRLGYVELFRNCG